MAICCCLKLRIQTVEIRMRRHHTVHGVVMDAMDGLTDGLVWTRVDYNLGGKKEINERPGGGKEGTNRHSMTQVFKIAARSPLLSCCCQHPLYSCRRINTSRCDADYIIAVVYSCVLRVNKYL